MKHGGDITIAAKQYGFPEANWLDLSTGISPWTYPVPDIPAHVWRSLPYDISPLLQSAEAYYGVPASMIIPVAGTQDAIRRIPRFLEVSSVAIPAIGYKEHQHAWLLAGHTVYVYHSWEELQGLVERGEVNHCVVINPNNPTAEVIDVDRLQTLYQAVSPRGYLLIDEAFMDVDETYSMRNAFMNTFDSQRLIIFRSVGKFFGLGGIRLGFVLGHGEIIQQLRDAIAPWGVSHPAIFIGEHALANTDWQYQQRQRILSQEQQLNQQLDKVFSGHPYIEKIHSAGLFVSLFGEAEFLLSLCDLAARQAIWLRHDILSEQQAWVRIGLPLSDEQRFSLFLESLLTESLFLESGCLDSSSLSV